MDSEPFAPPGEAAHFAFPTSPDDLTLRGRLELPAGWEVAVDVDEAGDEGPPAGPEGAFITGRHIVPARAHALGDDGWAYHLHSPRPYRARFTTRVALDAGEYHLSLAYFADWRYDFGGQTVPPDQPDHAQVRFVVGRRDVAWTTPNPLRQNKLDYVIRLDEPTALRLGFEVWSRYPATSNGFFLQAFSAKARSGLEAAGRYRVVVNLLPQDATLREKWHVLFQTHDARQAVLQSHDDAINLVRRGREDSYIRLWGRERLDTGQRAAIEAAGVGVQNEPLTGISLHALPEPGLEALSGVVINLLPQDATLTQKWHVLQAVHDGKQSLMQSHDDAFALLEMAGAGALARLWGGAGFLPEQTQRLQSLGVVLAAESYPPPRPVVAPPTGDFRFTHWPCASTLIWQHFGENPDRYREFDLPGHEGIDIEAPFGSPIVAVADGVVAANPNRESAYGIHVRIDHPGRYQTTYGHMERAVVAVGQAVRGGDIIGYADSTGHVWPAPTPERPHDGSHLHLTLKAFNQTTEYPYNIIDPTPFLRALSQYPAGAQPVVAPPAPSQVPTYDLLDYLRGDGRLYEVGGSGGQERFQTQRDGDRFYIVKNANWEELWADSDYIWRGFDTSPDNDRYYIQKEDGRDGARWANRRMRLGETFRGFGHHVQFYLKHDCSPSDLNSGRATNQTTLVAHHAALTWHNVTIPDVIELKGIGEERYFFARGFGLVGWRSPWGESGVAEVHALHARPDNVRLRIPCMTRG